MHIARACSACRTVSLGRAHLAVRMWTTTLSCRAACVHPRTPDHRFRPAARETNLIPGRLLTILVSMLMKPGDCDQTALTSRRRPTQWLFTSCAKSDVRSTGFRTWLQRFWWHTPCMALRTRGETPRNHWRNLQGEFRCHKRICKVHNGGPAGKAILVASVLCCRGLCGEGTPDRRPAPASARGPRGALRGVGRWRHAGIGVRREPPWRFRPIHSLRRLFFNFTAFDLGMFRSRGSTGNGLKSSRIGESANDPQRHYSKLSILLPNQCPCGGCGSHPGAAELGMRIGRDGDMLA